MKNGKHVVNNPKKHSLVSKKGMVLLVCILVVFISVGGVQAFITITTDANENLFNAAPIFELKYDANGGSDAPSDQYKISTADTHDFDVSEEEPSRDGYTFAGWADDADATEPAYQPVDSVTVGPDSHVKTIYAVWKHPFTLHYDAMGGTGAPADETESSAESSYEFVISPAKPTRDDFEFLGWTLDPNVDEPVIYDENTITVLAGEPDNYEKTLYAVWKVIGPCTLTYYWNDGGWNGQGVIFYGPTIYDKGGEVDIIQQEPWWNPKPDPSSGLLTYYTFLGWSEDQDATEATYNKNGIDGYDTIFLDKSETKLYAVWQKVVYSLPWVDYENYTINGEGQYRIDHLNDWQWNSYIDFDCVMNKGSYHEKINFPIRNLVPGTWYTIQFDETIGKYNIDDAYWNPWTGTYGCTVTREPVMKHNAGSQIGYTGNDVNTRYAWTYKDGNHTEYSPQGIRSINFLAEAETMYWVWDYSKLMDGDGKHLLLSNQQIYPLSTNGVPYHPTDVPYVDYVQSALYGFRSTHAAGSSDEDTYLTANGISTRKVFANTEQFEVQLVGISGKYELIDIPIHNLMVGQEYELSFNLDRTAGSSTRLNGKNNLFAFVVSETAYTDPSSQTKDFMKKLPNLCDCYDMSTITSISYRFTATAETMHWVWNLSALQDASTENGRENPADFHVFKFTNTVLTPVEESAKMLMLSPTAPTATLRLNAENMAVQQAGEDLASDAQLILNEKGDLVLVLAPAMTMEVPGAEPADDEEEQPSKKNAEEEKQEEVKAE